MALVFPRDISYSTICLYPWAVASWIEENPNYLLHGRNKIRKLYILSGNSNLISRMYGKRIFGILEPEDKIKWVRDSRGWNMIVTVLSYYITRKNVGVINWLYICRVKYPRLFRYIGDSIINRKFLSTYYIFPVKLIVAFTTTYNYKFILDELIHNEADSPQVAIKHRRWLNRYYRELIAKFPQSGRDIIVLKIKYDIGVSMICWVKTEMVNNIEYFRELMLAPPRMNTLKECCIYYMKYAAGNIEELMWMKDNYGVLSENASNSYVNYTWSWDHNRAVAVDELYSRLLKRILRLLVEN